MSQQNLQTCHCAVLHRVSSSREAGLRKIAQAPSLYSRKMASGSQKVVLITGCSSGIGLETAVMLAKDPENRFKVYAAMRNLGKKEQLEAEGKDVLGKALFIEKLDVTSEDQINNVVDNVLEKEGKFDILRRQ